MLTSLRQLEGLPVIWQDRQIGFVERSVPDSDAKHLQGLIIRKGLGAAKWAPSRAISLIGKRCVLLSSKPVSMPKQPIPQLKLAYLTSGERVGPITDGLLHRGSFRLVALEISPGTLQRLHGQSAYAQEYHVLREGLRQGQAMVTSLLSWTELEKALRKEDKQ